MKRKRMNRFLSLILSLMIVLSLTATPVYAAEVGSDESAVIVSTESTEAEEESLDEDEVQSDTSSSEGEASSSTGEETGTDSSNESSAEDEATSSTDGESGAVSSVASSTETTETEETEDSAAAALQEQIDALPSVDEVSVMDTDEQNEVYAEVSELWDAYYELSEDEQSSVDTSLLEELSDYFNGLTEVVDDAVAKIGDTTYETLVAAVSAAENDQTITITGTVSESETAITIENKSVTIDLNGQNVSIYYIIASTDATLTIMDSAASVSVDSDYKVTYTGGSLATSYNYGVSATNGGAVILASGKVSGTYGLRAWGDTTGSEEIVSTVKVTGGYVYAQECAVTVQGNGATAVISGGVMETADNAVVAGNGTSGHGGTSITISSGTLIGHIQTSSYVACGIYHPQSGTLNISGGTIYVDGGCGILMRGGTLNMTGGTIIATGTGSETGKVGDSRVVVTESGIVYDYDSNYYDVSNVSINLSGSVSVTAAASAISVVDTDKKVTSTAVTITGGTYLTTSDDGAVADTSVESYVASGYEYNATTGTVTSSTAENVALVTDSEGNTTYYTSLQSAFDNASLGSTVTLLSDITLTEQVTILNNLSDITFDGNNHTITCATTTDPSQSGGSALYFGGSDGSGSTYYCTGVTIKNLTMNGMARFGIMLYGGSSSTLENVTISGQYYYAINFYGTHGATMTNCSISNSYSSSINQYGMAIWANAQTAYPISLYNTTVSGIAINTYTSSVDYTKAKIFVYDGSSVGTITTYYNADFYSTYSLTPASCFETSGTGTVETVYYEDSTSETGWTQYVVAEIEDTEYYSLEVALAAAANGDTVTLLTDVTVDSSLTIDKSITLDLGNHTLTNTFVNESGTGVDRFSLITTANVTIQNGTYVTTAPETTNGVETRGIVESSGDLTLDNVTVTCNGISVCNYAEGGTLTITDSDISGTYAVGSFANNSTVKISGSALTGSVCGLYHNGSYYGLNLIVTDTKITGGSGSDEDRDASSDDATGVYISGSIYTTANNNGTNQQASFTGCTITGSTGIEVKYTDLTLENCTVTATAETPTFEQYNNGSTTAGFAVVSTDNSMDPEDPEPCGTITITSGTYTGLVGLASLVDEEEYSDFNEADYVISGGTAESESTNLRFISTVDTTSYQTVGFKITFNGTTIYKASSTVYSKLTGSDGSSLTTYVPQNFSSASKYFITYTINNVPQASFDDSFVVTPYWITLDGTTVYGTTNTLKVSMGYSSSATE